ncbi:MAG: DUF255 domain-containing protein [Candidatus Dormibacteraeota bacterium]|nr:DUF255 domain-containing protein [Candidatus Dormibacteraeota bacterium]
MTTASELHFSPRPNRAHEIPWRPWSEAAFAEARAADRPILLSISAVWCHWCHVMDETTYSDPKVIDLISRTYVPIRVDNDVRPDINQRYNMGGWPTTAFLTPEGDILTGATYLPPEQLADALIKVAGHFRDHRPEIAATVLEGRRRAGLQVAASAGSLDPGQVDRVLGAVEQAYDREYGGFGVAPKFPQTDAICLLAEQSTVRSEPALMEMARHTLAQMAGGGTYDRVEDGFFRYSTTQDWSVPHFEKMLEDHGGLLSALALTGQAEVLDGAMRYLRAVLRDPETGLYAGSQDADEHYYAQDRAGRAALTPPYVDRRVYVAWNLRLAVALHEAGRRLARPDLTGEGVDLARTVLDRYAAPDGGVLHTDGVGGQLADQVWALLACVRIGEETRARSLAGHLAEAYADAGLGGFFDRTAGDDLGRLGERLKPLDENAVAAIALDELGESELARRALESVAALPRRYGLMAAVYARALDRVRREPVKVTTTDPGLSAAALAVYPYAVIEAAGGARAVVCVGTTCHAPVATAAELQELLTQRA